MTGLATHPQETVREAPAFEVLVELALATEQFYTFQYLGRRFSNHYVVTAYEPMSLTAYKSLPDSSVQATGENRFESVDNGTRLTVAFNPQVGGFFGRIPKSVVAWSYSRTLKGNLTRIKKILEGIQ